MFDDVAVPDIQTGEIEQRFDPCDLSRVRNHGVLEARFPVFWRAGNAVERLTIDDLKLHFVNVNRVSVFREVVYLPDFDGVQGRILCDRIPPSFGDRVSGSVKRAEEGRNRAIKSRMSAPQFVERHLPRVTGRAQGFERG